MSYEQLAQSVDGLHTQVTALTQGIQDALKRTADLAKVNNSYPFTFVPGQVQYDVVVISGDPKMTTAGMGLWIEGAIEYAFTVDSLTKFTLQSTENYSATTQMRLLGNKRFDDLVQNFDDLEGIISGQYSAEKIARTTDYYNYLSKLEFEVAVPYVAGISIVRPTQTVTYLGVRYRPKASTLPFTTVSWASDTAKFLNAEDMTLRQALGAVDGCEVVNRYGQNLAVSLQNLNGAAGLKRFINKLFTNPSEKRFNVNLVGTSIATGDSPGAIFGQALAAYFGASKSEKLFFAAQAEQPISGWKAQYYSGTYSTRLKGGNGDGALPLVFQRRAKSITIFYSKEIDGGSVGVTIQTANQTPVAQTPINCQGATAIGQSVTYALNPDLPSTVTITPPTTGYGHLEYYVFDAGDYGLMFSNTAYGGSGLWAHFGDGPLGAVVRPGLGTMYPSATPSGLLGAIATFAPTDPQVKADLVIYSGPTNDAGNVTKFPGQLRNAVQLAVDNGSACILVIEPINGSISRASWDTLRAAYYAVAAEFPDNVFVYDYDAFISWDLEFNPRFHSPSLSDPHPGNYGYGHPHIAAGYDLCQRLGVPFQRKQGRVSTPELARVYTQVFEPRNAAVGSIWNDTSNGLPGVRKKLVSRGEGYGSRGLWSCDSGDNKVVIPYDQDYLINGATAFGSKVAGVNFQGDPCVVLTGQTAWTLDNTKFVPGETYTLSYLHEASAFSRFNTLFTFGNNPFLTAKVFQQAFVQSGSVSVTGVDNSYGPGSIQRFVLTVKWPTLEEQAAATAAGINMSVFRLTIQAGAVAIPVSIWNFRIEKGAGVTIATAPVVNLATTMPLGPTVSAVEPLPTVVSEGGAWSDTSVTPPMLKRMLQKDCLLNIANVAPGVFGTGVSLWRPPAPQVNLLEGFIDAATITILSGGSSAVKGNFGPGNRRGFRWDTLTGDSSTQIEITAPAGMVNLTPNAVYTISYLVRCGRGDQVIDPTTTMGFYTNLREFIGVDAATNLQLQKDLVTWTSNPGQWKTCQVPRDQQYCRLKLTFKAYASPPGALINNIFQLMLLSVNRQNQWAELSDFRLELGASVTAD